MSLKNVVCDHPIGRGYAVEDKGVYSDDPVDYPDIGASIAEEVRQGKYERALLVCGTGAGMAIVANKLPGVRGVCINDPYTAERAVASNNAQIVTPGSLVVGPEVAKKLVDIWLESEYEVGRSTPKIAKIEELDKIYHS